ncbi:hypothetical protein X801_03887, partial [Opisthorchis viverrini]
MIYYWADHLEHPRLWFAQAEANFEYRRVRSRQTKYSCVVAHLSPEVAVEIADIIYEKPDVNSCDVLRDALIKRTAGTNEQNLRVLLVGMELVLVAPAPRQACYMKTDYK